jgi:hypothetical protein
MTIAGSALPFPNPRGVDPKRVRMWDPLKPGRPEHDAGDLVVGIAPPPGATLPGFMSAGGWTLDGPLWLPGFDLRPRGTLPANYSTADKPVLGLRGAICPFQYGPKCHSHWPHERGDNAFAYLSNTYLDYQNNDDGMPCSFADLFKVKVDGCRPGIGRRISILMSRCRMWYGPHYISLTIDPTQNGHADGVQCMGGVDDVRAGDSIFRVPGIQLFFLGREASLVGYDPKTVWEFTRVTMDHIPAWNPNVKVHDFNLHPKFVQGYEGAAGIHRTSLSLGRYLQTKFTDCNIRGPYSREQIPDIMQYLSPAPSGGLDENGYFRFSKNVHAPNKRPMYSGTLKYFQPGELLPTLCPPEHVGPQHRVTTVDEAMAAMLNTL